MRFLYIVIICIFAYANVLAADAQLLPDKNGFGGIKWGTEFSDKLGMTGCIDYGLRIACNKANEEVKALVGIPITATYSFYGGYFNMVTFEFDGVYNWTKIINLLTQIYGKNEEGEGFKYGSHPAGLDAVYNFYYPLRKQAFNVQGIVLNGDRDKLEVAGAKRFKEVALSIFTDVEREDLAGFLGHKWGDTIDKVGKDMLLVEIKENTKIYTKNEQPYFGGIPVYEINYTFLNDKLVEVSIYGLDLNRTNVLRHLELNFGKFKHDHERDLYSKDLPKTSILISKFYYNGTAIHARNTDPILQAEIEGCKSPAVQTIIIDKFWSIIEASVDGGLSPTFKKIVSLSTENIKTVKPNGTGYICKAEIMSKVTNEDLFNKYKLFAPEIDKKDVEKSIELEYVVTFNDNKQAINVEFVNKEN